MEQKYVVSVDKCESAQEAEMGKEKSSKDNSYAQEVCYEVVKTEYEHNLGRIAKLDQKISFTLAVCALIAPMLYDSVKVFKDYSPFVVPYYIVLVITIVVFVAIIIQLLGLLQTETIRHYAPQKIVNDKMFEKDSVDVVKSICEDYTKYIQANNVLLNHKAKIFNRCVYASTAMVISIFAIKIISKCF